MKNRDLMKKARFYSDIEDYNSALNCIKQISKNYTFSVQDLLFKVRIILLSDDDEYFTFSDIQTILEDILSSDENNLEALLEFGHFYSVVKDDHEKATYYFQKVLKQSNRFYFEALEGIRDALSAAEPLDYYEKYIKNIDEILKIEKSIPNAIKIEFKK